MDEKDNPLRCLSALRPTSKARGSRDQQRDLDMLRGMPDDKGFGQYQPDILAGSFLSLVAFLIPSSTDMPQSFIE